MSLGNPDKKKQLRDSFNFAHLAWHDVQNYTQVFHTFTLLNNITFNPTIKITFILSSIDNQKLSIIYK